MRLLFFILLFITNFSYGNDDTTTYKIPHINKGITKDFYLDGCITTYKWMDGSHLVFNLPEYPRRPNVEIHIYDVVTDRVVYVTTIEHITRNLDVTIPKGKYILLLNIVYSLEDQTMVVVELD